jgi:DNA (cytosine-5)-methyltransferase 1
LKVVGLFAGIGGIERGLHLGWQGDVETGMLCESWEPAQAVLEARFPDAELHPDVREFHEVPHETTILTAGFPCTDLSQAGRTAGIGGSQSGLVTRVFEALRGSRQLPTWLVIENVQNMLALDGGRAMQYLVDELESIGMRWAYRTVDSRFTGVPQRRRRVILVASAIEDPSGVLFADEAGDPDPGRYATDSYGFYWTEGLRGLGWAQDAVPTLKGGSTVGIPSPPAIWVPDGEPGRKLLWPRIEDAEALQGFPRGWTEPGGDGRRDGARWKMVGNAVTVGVARWVGQRLQEPGEVRIDLTPLDGPWPHAAAGGSGQRWKAHASEYPRLEPYQHLLQVVDVDELTPMSFRAVRGFGDRLMRGNLGRHPGFRDDVLEHIEAMSPISVASA